jgi:hypothetical protein
MDELTPRMRAVLEAMREHSDPAPPASEENGWKTPRRIAYAFQAAEAIERAGLYRRNPRAAGTRPATGAANTLIGLRRRGLVAGGAGMAFDSTWWWITPEGVEALNGGNS